MATSVQDDIRELAEIARVQRQRRWRRDPVAWARERLGVVLWSKQREIMEAVRDHRRVAVASCHSIGKSYISAVIVAWWIDCHDAGEAFALTSAPTSSQVRAILWREIGRVHAGGQLDGRVNQTEWHRVTAKGNEELVAMGRKPNEFEPTAFQGIHAPAVIFVFDEACGMPGSLLEAGDSLISNDAGKAFLVGNPDDPQTEFASVCRPGSGYHVIHVGAFDTPNLTGEHLDTDELNERFIKGQLIGRRYIEEKRRKWAPHWTWNEDETRVVCPEGQDEYDTHPFWQSKILGRFPRRGDSGTLISQDLIRAAQQRELRPSEPNELGVDVGAGGDATTGCHRRGPVARIIWEDHNPDTMHTCGVMTDFIDWLGIERAKIDEIGIGKGVVDRAQELDYPVVGVNVGMKSDELLTRADKKLGKVKRFVNLRAQFWWTVRELFESGDIDIDERDEDLAAELVELRYKRLSSGKILIESKDDAKRRGVPSPNRADALMLAMNEPPVVKRRSATWG